MTPPIVSANETTTQEQQNPQLITDRAGGNLPSHAIGQTTPAETTPVELSRSEISDSYLREVECQINQAGYGIELANYSHKPTFTVGTWFSDKDIVSVADTVAGTHAILIAFFEMRARQFSEMAKITRKIDPAKWTDTDDCQIEPPLPSEFETAREPGEIRDTDAWFAVNSETNAAQFSSPFKDVVEQFVEIAGPELFRLVSNAEYHSVKATDD